MIHYLQTNKIAVYGTLVGDSAAWGEGYIEQVSPALHHVRQRALQVHRRDRRQADSERNLNGIEKSYANIAEEARNQYTLVYCQPRVVLSTASSARSMCASIARAWM